MFHYVPFGTSFPMLSYILKRTKILIKLPGNQFENNYALIPKKITAVDKATIDTSSIIIVPTIAPGIIIEFGDIIAGIIEVAITAYKEKWNHSEQIKIILLDDFITGNCETVWSLDTIIPVLLTWEDLVYKYVFVWDGFVSSVWDVKLLLLGTTKNMIMHVIIIIICGKLTDHLFLSVHLLFLFQRHLQQTQ